MKLIILQKREILNLAISNTLYKFFVAYSPTKSANGETVRIINIIRTALFSVRLLSQGLIEHDDTSPQVIYMERDRDSLFTNRMLKKAADNNYVLTSKQVQEILGIRPKGKTFSRLGFLFTKVGKDGVYSSYKVERQ